VVFQSKDTFKFNAAHFVPLLLVNVSTGHNYRVSVRLLGERAIGADESCGLMATPPLPKAVKPETNTLSAPSIRMY
jgi:hypothetical protein